MDRDDVCAEIPAVPKASLRSFARVNDERPERGGATPTRISTVSWVVCRTDQQDDRGVVVAGITFWPRRSSSLYTHELSRNPGVFSPQVLLGPITRPRPMAEAAMGARAWRSGRSVAWVRIASSVDSTRLQCRREWRRAAPYSDSNLARDSQSDRWTTRLKLEAPATVDKVRHGLGRGRSPRCRMGIAFPSQSLPERFPEYVPWTLRLGRSAVWAALRIVPNGVELRALHGRRAAVESVALER